MYFYKPVKIENIHHLKPPPRNFIFIASSMGGTNVLPRILPEFDFIHNASMIIVQHMPEYFTPRFANRLNDLSPFEVIQAQDGTILERNKAYLAPGNYHLKFNRGKLGWISCKLTKEKHVKGVRPAADVSMNSLASIKYIKIIAIILTGMGSDGSDGIKMIKQNGGTLIVQDPKTCECYGMPQSSIDTGLTDEIVDPDNIPSIVKKTIDSKR